MNLQNFSRSGMSRVNIRCCCEPGKIIGTLDLYSYQVKVGRVRVPVRPLQSIVDYDISAKPELVQKLESEEVQLREFRDPRKGYSPFEIAIYSDDKPKDFWERFPSFNPAPP